MSSKFADWGDSVDDGSKLVRTLHRLLSSDPEASCEESSEESGELVTVSEGSYHSEASVLAAVTYSAAAQKNLPKRTFRKKSRFAQAIYQSLKKNIFIMPNRPYMAFFMAPAASFTNKDIFNALLSDGVPASVAQSLQRSPNGNVLITFASRQYHDLFLPRFSLLVR